MTISSVNPATGREIQAYSELEPEAVDRAIRDADRAWTAWRGAPFADRARVLRSAASELRSRKADLARLKDECARQRRPYEQLGRTCHTRSSRSCIG